MSSVLKILVDATCEVYCDYEFKGEATPQSIFKIELRKGVYILEFKLNGDILYSCEYTMRSNDEDDLLRVYINKKNNKQGSEIIVKKENASENKKDIINNAKVKSHLDEIFDSCDQSYWITGAKDGDDIYCYIVCLQGKYGLYDEYGNQILDLNYNAIKGVYPNMFLTQSGGKWLVFDAYERKFIEGPLDEFSEGWGYQLIMRFGNLQRVYDCAQKVFLPFKFDKIEKSWSHYCYIVTQNEKKGLYSYDSKRLFDVIYDEIDAHDEVVVSILNGFVVIYDFDGNILFDKQYQYGVKMRYKSYWRKWINVEGFEGEFLIEPTIIKRDGKWGVINKNFWLVDYKREIPFIKEYVPCKYDKLAYSDWELVTDENLDKEDCVKYFVNEDANGDLHFYEYHLINDNACTVEEWIKNDDNTYYLFFDTETTGTPLKYNVPSYNTENWPRLVQLSWILMTEDCEKVTEKNYIVKPDGFTIPKEVSDIHKITTQYALACGRELGSVIDDFLRDFNKSKFIVGHNIEFDKKILGAELVRLGKFDTMNTKKSLCTMKSSVDFCKIPGKYGFKYPKLQELYFKLFGRNFVEAHNAINDVEATQQCFWELRKRKLI